MLTAYALTVTGSSWWILVPVLGTLALVLYAGDPVILIWVQRRRNRVTDSIARLVKPLGDGRYTLPPLALLFFIGWLAQIAWAMRLAVACMVSFLVTGIICQFLQICTRRYRPETSSSARDWSGPHMRSVHRSFPSGHASASASILVAVALLAQGLPWLQIIALLLTVLTALSRLNDRAHWPSDIYVGATIGTSIAYATVVLLPHWYR